MGYLFLAVVFYTVVKFGFERWSQLRYEFNDRARDYGYGHNIRKLTKRIDELEKTETEDDVDLG